MSLKLTGNPSNPPIGAILAAGFVRNSNIQIEWGKENVLTVSKELTIESNAGMCRYIARLSKDQNLYGKEVLSKTEVDHWLSFSIGPLSCNSTFDDSLSYLDRVLGPVTYLVGNDITIADLSVWGTLILNQSWSKIQQNGSPYKNTSRWFSHINSLNVVQSVLQSLPTDVINKSKETAKTTEFKDEGKFVELPGAEMGKVVVRFPPEASGFLHIGHAKAALLNQYYQEAFKGKLIMRFDDTNPDKEKVDFEKVILEDLKLLDIKPDMFTHTSSYFDKMLELCEKLINDGKAYVDNTDPETMKQEREQRTESKNRSNDVGKNMSMWKEMLKGSEVGQKCCVRAKIDMSSDNGCMRDPTIYRCKNEPHPRTGKKFKVYPTYDFACPVVDSIEGVTHALRTMEYHDRDEQFYWFIDALGLRKPYIWEYSRLNMMNTVLSKRKLTWFVDEGIVDSWEDPRFPTVRGVLRRGMTIEGLRQFIIAQGSSRSVVQMEWDKIWAFNKKVIDPIAPRFTALEKDQLVVVNIADAKTESLSVLKHPKNPSVGNKTVWVGSKVYIEKVDAQQLKEGKNATFINWGNIKIKKIHTDSASGNITSVDAETNLTDTDFKKTLKITWLAVNEQSKLIPIDVYYYDHIITKPVLGRDEDFKKYINYNSKKLVQYVGDGELCDLKVDDIIQLQRIGFFRCDSTYSSDKPLVLIHVPDGSSKPPAAASLTNQTQVTATNPADPNLIPLTNEDLEQIAVQWSLDREHLIKQTADVGNVSTSVAEEINNKIIEQGNKIRNLKTQKADKTAVEVEVKTLLSLKADYKSATGSDWKPGAVATSPAAAVTPPAPTVNTTESNDLSVKITEQGDVVRKLKAGKAEKTLVEVELKTLLALKTKYKTLTGKDWQPQSQDKQETKKSEQVNVDCNITNDLLHKIAEQGNKVRKLKSDKAAKNEVDAAVNILLQLKSQFKNVSGTDWKPGMKPVEQVQKSDSADGKAEIEARITDQGNRVRNLKNEKAAKDVIDDAVKVLLALKDDYKNITGEVWKPPGGGGGDRQTTKKVEKPKKEQTPDNTKDVSGGAKKQSRLGMEATKEDNLPDWYSQVITKGELIEYYDVSGCYILRPWAFAIWDAIKDFFDREIKELGVQNCYFPMFVSKTVLEKEKTHIADFSPEVAWVTKSGETELSEHIAIRPTSETVMYPAYAKWIQSYRDLPMKLNQWNSVVRWEFKHPQPFIRTREFLWQEGHTAFASYKEAEEEVFQILDLYERIYTELLAIPVVKGKKTEKEKFAGGNFTTTVEAYVSATGRGIQGGTSHHLGQNFSKIFEIVYEDPETQEKKYVYQNSWGISTRTIGVMIMVHADNQGLVLPPRVAALQVVIVPCGITVNLKQAEKDKLLEECSALEKDLKMAAVRVKYDQRDNYSPGWKFNHWELKGVPLRIELGPKDLQKLQLIAVRRDTGEKVTIPMKTAVTDIKKLLDKIHDNMLERATADLKSHTVLSRSWNEFCDALEKKNIICAPFCGAVDCEDKIKKDSARDEDVDSNAPSMGAKSLCTPFEQPEKITNSDRCIYPSCNNKPISFTLFGRSY